MDGRHHVTLSPFTASVWFALVGISAGGAVLSSVLSYETWGFVARNIPSLVGIVDMRLSRMQKEQYAALKRFDHMISRTRKDLAATQKEQATLREKIAHVQGEIETHLKWQKGTGARLTKLEKTATATKQVVEHVDRKVDQIVPMPVPATGPWWKVWK